MDAVFGLLRMRFAVLFNIFGFKAWGFFFSLFNLEKFSLVEVAVVGEKKFVQAGDYLSVI